MTPLLLTLDDNIHLRAGLERHAQWQRGECSVRHFPDGESYVRVLSDCRDRDVIILCGLHNPDARILPLLFCCDALKELGARRIGLIAPYLAYMRQDRRFHAGEAISSRSFAKLLSQNFHWLMTVDPHLHRYHDLGEIYSIPAVTLSAATLLSQWITQHVAQPLLIGPDSESEQWVAAIAQRAQAPYLILNKIRKGDADVEVSVPDVERWHAHTPVLVDDIISTGHTLLETIAHLRAARMRAPVCVAVHGLFADGAYEKLITAGAARVITTNSVAHVSNGIDLSALLLDAANEIIKKPAQ